jgi:hypothetical protein
MTGNKNSSRRRFCDGRIITEISAKINRFFRLLSVEIKFYNDFSASLIFKPI